MEVSSDIKLVSTRLLTWNCGRVITQPTHDKPTMASEKRNVVVNRKCFKYKVASCTFSHGQSTDHSQSEDGV